jgi:dienelactone hydrolase
MTAPPVRFRDRSITLGNGSVGENIDIPSASPSSYYQVLSLTADMARITLDGKLFLPPGFARGPLPLVIVVPGSLGVAGSHLAHAEAITGAGIAALVLDPLLRAWDRLNGWRSDAVLVCRQCLRRSGGVASRRVARRDRLVPRRRAGARGGSAVLTAATRRFADRVVGEARGLHSVLAAYPWSGHQFLNPGVGDTEIRILMGERDDWCSPMQVQGHVQAIRLAGGSVSLRLFTGAAHGFDRGTPHRRIGEAAVSPAAPTAYIADDGAFIHPLSGPKPRLRDRDLMVYALNPGTASRVQPLAAAATRRSCFAPI